MFVTYSPESGDVQRWTFDPKRVRASQAEAIEKRAGETWDQWQASVQSGSMRARRVLLWHLMSQDHPSLRWEDMPDFFADEVVVEHSAAELKAIRDQVDKAVVDAAQKEQILAALDAEIAAAAEREGEPEGKATSSDAEPSTGSPSRRRSTSGRGSSDS